MDAGAPDRKEHKGWHSRASPHPSPLTIDFSKATLLMGYTYSAMRSQGIHMALFQLETGEHVAVDEAGRVLILEASDAMTFTTLLKGVLKLSASEFVIRVAMTCQPHDFVTVPINEGKFRTFGIFRSTASSSRDSRPELPDVMVALSSLVREARAVHPNELEKATEQNAGVLKTVEELIERAKNN